MTKTKTARTAKAAARTEAAVDALPGALPGALPELVAAELAEPVDERINAVASAIAERYPETARAILFYGSCLREKHRGVGKLAGEELLEADSLDGTDMLDFYLIVSQYRAAYRKHWLVIANRLIPPNVFPFEHGGLTAKYAVLSEADFYRLNGPETRNVSVWARFSQPARLVWFADATAQAQAIAAVSRAAPTLLWSVSALICAPAPDAQVPARASALDQADPLQPWRIGFAHTYAAELRAEKRERSLSLIEADTERYKHFTNPALAAIEGPPQTAAQARRLWRWRRIESKALSILRLAKASLTYTGGIDYLAWKINRHSGTQIEIKEWHRRWPLIAACVLLPKLMSSGAIK